ncbi:MAG: DUF1572 family protein [Pirellulaceae bacterium]|jgi:uncharacterized damage-inducible protein DinB|nr:DUF1572 family protein [Pirellulaceae bacterium]
MSSVSSEQLAAAILTTLDERLSYSTKKIAHCADQLSEQQFWWQPGEGQNSIANLCLHLAGNLRQWILLGVGGEESVRDRPAEFADRSRRPKSEIIAELTTVVARAQQVLNSDSCRADKLVGQRCTQGFDVTVVQAVNEAVSHFVGHMHQIVLLTRFQLGDQYQFHWEPSTPAERSAG